MGDDQFLDTVRNKQNVASIEIALDTILRAIYRIYNVDQAELGSPSRSENLSIARGATAAFARQKGHTLENIAKIFNRDGSSLGRLEQRFMQKYANNEEIQSQYRLLEEAVSRFAVLQA